MTDALAALSNDRGATWAATQIPGVSPGSEGGFDVQRAGANQFAAADGVVARATTLGGAFSDYYTITGGVQAACVIVPYYNWAGTKQTTAVHPDILVGLTGADGSSRTLLWIEGGATPGTVHDLTPVADFNFSNPDAITVRWHNMLAVWGTVSGVSTVRTTVNQGGAWTNRGTITAPGKIRCRRNDSRLSPAGQCYLLQGGELEYTRSWYSTGLFPRVLPTSGITMMDTIF